MVSTRAAAFAGKISNLRESIVRIQNGTLPQPTCIDLANMMKYFSQVLHDFRDYKDIENVPLYANEKRDRTQLIKSLPNYDYSGLYHTLSRLVDILPLIPQTSNGLDQLGSNLLMLFKSLIPFLDHENMESVPYLVSTLFMSLPSTLHKEILDTLCFNLLPFTIDQQQRQTASILRRANRMRANQARRFKKREKPAHCIVRIEEPKDPVETTKFGNETKKLITTRSHGRTNNKDASADNSDAGYGEDHEDEAADGDDDDDEQEIEDDDYALLSVTSILLIGFHYITEPSHHSQLVECLLKLKSNVFEDLLYVIAYGTTRARCPAVELLFRYWPDICPNQQDRKNNNQTNKLRHIAWQPIKCQNKNCTSSSLGDDDAVKMCLDFRLSITLSGQPPPMLICLDCVDQIYKQHRRGSVSGSKSISNGGQVPIDSIQAMDDLGNKIIDFLLPLENISKLCENKKCKSSDRVAVGTCFDIECANYNCKKPIRYCRQCFKSQHEPCESNNYDITLQSHIRHSSINLAIMESEENINNFIEAIISLLKEAAPADRPPKDSERYLRSLMGPMSQFGGDNKEMNIATEEKQLISQYGIWLMTGLCKSVRDISDELLGRLLGMLFQWFHFTACLPDDQAGSALEKLKGECIKGWIMSVKEERLDVFISCLLPHPIDCSKIGGHWEVWPGTAHQIKEGFKRLLCLVPYDIITDDVWDEIMPYWMECFRHEVPENELSELKILLSKVFDPELSPLGFETKQMYNFISSRFEDSSNSNQEQTLYWLQIITMLDIPIPIEFLFQMLMSSVRSLAQMRSNELNKMRIASRLAELDKLSIGGVVGSASRSSMSACSVPGEASGQSSCGDEASGVGSDGSAGSLARISAGSKGDSDQDGECEDEEDDDREDSEDGDLDDEEVHDDDDDDDCDPDDGDEPTESGDKISTLQPTGSQLDNDDVLLPASGSCPLTRQERQAQARAAFSARIAQHAALMDAHQNQPTITSSVSSLSPSSTTTQVAATANQTAALGEMGLPGSGHRQPLKSTMSSVSSSGASSQQPQANEASGGQLDSERRHHRRSRKPKSSQRGATSAKAMRRGDRSTRKSRSSGSQGLEAVGGRPKLRVQTNSIEEYLSINRVDNNLVCYILIMDILLKQLDIQEINSHRGFESREAQRTIELLNSIISTPWIGRHTCSEAAGSANGELTTATTTTSGETGHQTGGSSSGASHVTKDSVASRTESIGGTGSVSVSAQKTTKLGFSIPADSTGHAHQQHQSQSPFQVGDLSHCAQGFEGVEDPWETCVFCEIISTFHQLAMSLIEFFSPLIEVSICEVSPDDANGEFDGKPDYSRIGIDHLGGSSPTTVITDNSEDVPSASGSHKIGGSKFDFNPSSLEQVASSSRKLTAPNSANAITLSSSACNLDQPLRSPFSPSYLGPSLKPEVLRSLPMELQFTYNLLVQFHQYQTPTIVSQLIQMIKLMSLHSQVLSKASKNNPQFIAWCQHNMLIGKLWSLCELESSEISRTCVPLLLHCITLPWGVRIFRDLVERDFNSENWLSRFRAVERVVTIAYFCEPSTIKNSTLLQSSIASCFCFVVRCLDDIEAIVAQRALVNLEMLRTSSLKLLLWCLEVQFDYIIADRPIILKTVFQLYNHLKERRLLTWDFFLNRFDTIFLEAQIHLQQTGEIPSFTMQDLKNTNTKSEIYQKKISRAKEALQEIHHSRSLSTRLNHGQRRSLQDSGLVQPAGGSQTAAKSSSSSSSHLEDPGALLRQSLRMQRQIESNQVNSSAIASNSVGKPQLSSSLAIVSPVTKLMRHGESTASRYQSVAYLMSQSMVRRKNSSKFMVNLAMQSVPPHMSLPDKLHQHLPNSFVDDGSKLNEIAQENHVFGVIHRASDEDRDTMHSLIYLIMQFFSKPDPSHPQSLKSVNRSHQIVLRHLNILVGFSVARRNFLISASNLRLLPAFNAMLTSLPKVLDFNHSLGSILLDTCLPLLIYAPATEDVQYDQTKIPGYSLWLLNPLMRQSWLLSVLSFLYKYPFSQPHLKEYVYKIIWIVINTLESHLNCTNIDMALDGLLPVSNNHSGVSQLVGSSRNSSNATTATNQPDVTGADHTTPSHQTTTNLEASSSTPKHQGPKIGGKDASSASEVIEMSHFGHRSQTVAISNSSEAIAKTTSSPTVKPLVKADTSDSLLVKAKISQRKNEAFSGSTSATSQHHRVIDMTSVDQPGDVVELTPVQQTSAAKFSTVDERLLPIGILTSPAACSKSGSNFDLPSSERLLPIGAQLSSSSRVGVKPSVGSNPIFTHTASPAKVKQMINERSKVKAIVDITSGSNQGHDLDPPQKSTISCQNVQDPTKGSQANATTTTTTAAAAAASAIQLPTTDSTSITETTSVLTTNQQTLTPSRVAKSAQRLSDKATGSGTTPSATLKASFSSPSLLNEQLAQINRHSFIQEFSDKDLSMCLVILETFIHHEPSMAAHLLPNILRLVARYAIANQDSSQPSNQAGGHLVGGSMFVARQFIRVSLYDLMDNNIFHQIFTSHFTGHYFYKSLATALADFTDLNQLAPLSKLFEDLNKQKNLPQLNPLVRILENVATYFECIISESAGSHSQYTWNNLVANWENFLRKLILALPRFNGSSSSSSSSGGTGGAGSNNTSVSGSGAVVTGSAGVSGSGSGGAPLSGSGAGGSVLATSSSAVGSASVANSGPSGKRNQRGPQRQAGGPIAAASNLPGRSGDQAPADAANGVSGTTGEPLAGEAIAVGSGQGQVSSSGANAVTGNGPNIPSGSQSAAAAGTNQAVSSSSSGPAGGSGSAAASSSGPSTCSLIMMPIMRIILSTTKISQLASCKTIVDPYSKIISYTVLNSNFRYEHLLEINHNCCRLYARDREKYLIQRTIAYELVQVLKFRFFILEENLLVLLLFILQDVGGTLPPKVLRDNLKLSQLSLEQAAESYVTNVSECLRQYTGDLLEFITDVHAISRINDNLINSAHQAQPSSINRDSFGGHVKAAISQFLALEMSLSNANQAAGNDSAARSVPRYLPWLYTSPSLQQGPREFVDCISHIRQLSWIILGSLLHTTLSRLRRQASIGSGPSSSLGGASSGAGGVGSAGSPLLLHNFGGSGQGQQTAPVASSAVAAGLAATGMAGSLVGAGTATLNTTQHHYNQHHHHQVLGLPGQGAGSSQASVISSSPSPGQMGPSCQPIPIEKNGNVAEHVQAILAGFAEQSKESVLHMSGLFHAFLLCQLWTMYCETLAGQRSPGSEEHQFCQATLDDFWSKITPGVLRLVGHSRVMSEMVSTHFLQLIESLIESNSSILVRYLPMWNSVFYSYKRRNKSGNLAIRLQKCIEWKPPDLSEHDEDQNNRRLLSWLEKVQYKMSHIEIQSSQAAPFYLT